jgi:anti-sigma factor RsiW
MQCDRTGETIGAYIDQELNPATRTEVAAHLADCPACSALAEKLQRVSGQVAALGRELAPAHLATEIRHRLAAASPPPARSPLPLAVAIERLPLKRWIGRAAALLLACALTAAATVLVISRMDATASLEREVVAAHVRSLLQDSPTQIASSEAHTVKPWFAGRLEFAPSVKDLASEGFPLVGARLDYIGERRVAALVYRRRLHVVNVFLWPSAEAADSAPVSLVHRGYNIVTFNKGGIAYWAISDLNMTELRLLQSLL